MRWPIDKPSHDFRERQRQQMLAADLLKTRGSGKRPAAPRSVQVTAGRSSVLVTWYPPDLSQRKDIYGWRVYKGNETTCVASIDDPIVTQCTVPSSAGSSTSPNYTFFVSSVNAAGDESARIPCIGAATAENPSATVTPPTSAVAPPEQAAAATTSTRTRGIETNLTA